MNTKKTLLTLWIIFGFVFIQAVDSVLFFLIHLLYFGTVTIGTSYSVLNFALPIITASIYLMTVILLLKRIKINSGTSGILLTRFPKGLFLNILILAIVLNPITNKVSGLFPEWITEIRNHNTTEFIESYGWMHLSIGIARWVSLIVLALVYLNKYELKEIKS